MHGAFVLTCTTLLILFKIIFSLPTEKLECPVMPDGPCDCLQPYGNVIVVCNEATHHKQLQKAMETMKGYRITEFHLRSSTIYYIPHDLFTDTSLVRIKISKSTLVHLFDCSLEGVEKTLAEIYLEDVLFDGGFDWRVLNSLENLQLLGVVNTELYQVTRSITNLSLPLHTLLLVRDQITSLHDEAFRYFTDLKNLRLNDNQISSFNRKLLPYPQTQLRLLDLSNNRISSLPSDMFQGIPHLDTLILKGNLLSSLKKEVFLAVWNNLLFFSAFENPLNCDCDVSWIVDLEKPIHFHGECAMPTQLNRKNLVSLQKNDFEVC